jgi:hypothetical protein
MQTVRVGNRQAAASDLLAFTRGYLGPAGRWSYPAYDGYQPASAAGPLIDADLLAPMLLNVNHMKLKAYYLLLEELPYLQTVLTRLDQAGPGDLASASAEQLTIIGELFEGVNHPPRLKGASATTLSKVLHRKRPGLIPLQDAQVRRCFQQGPGAPLPRKPGRTWVQFTTELASVIQADLREQAGVWQAVADLATDPVITPLRAYDIAAWWLGGMATPTYTSRT